MTPKQMQKNIEKMQEAIAKQRDRIDAFISEAEALRECCEEASDALLVARDALSQYV